MSVPDRTQTTARFYPSALLQREYWWKTPVDGAPFWCRGTGFSLKGFENNGKDWVKTKIMIGC